VTAPTTPIADFIREWQTATSESDSEWLDAHIHSAGTARGTTTATPTPDPEPTPTVTTTVTARDIAKAHGWTYPKAEKGFITRPNGEKYRTRKVEGVVDVDLLRDSRAWNEHVFLYGEPGTGKTALVEAAFGGEVVTMLGTEDTEVSDFIGAYGPRPDGKYGWTDGALIEAAERDCPLFVDEIGVIAPKVLTTLFSVQDGRNELRITANPDRGTVKFGKGFMVIAATNPHAPGVRLSEALLSRFAVHMEVGTDYSMMRELGVPDSAVTAAENLEKRRTTGEVSWAPQSRELLRFMHQVERRGEKIALRNLIGSSPEDDREVVAEVLGRTFGRKVKALAL
jgi:nitric oxide reductase NorQ protein